MLADKQIFLCCVFLSLGFHLVTGMVSYFNAPSWDKVVKLSGAAIQVALIDRIAGTIAKPVEKKTGEIIPSPVTAISPIIQPEMIPQAVPSRKESQLVSNPRHPDRIIPKEKPLEQLSQSAATPQDVKKVVAITQVKDIQKTSEQQILMERFSGGKETVIPSYHSEGGTAEEESEQTLSARITEKQIPGEDVGKPDQEIERAYLLRIRQMVEQHLDYPPRARRLHSAGTVNLHFRISASGDIDEILIQAESPHPILNQAAIRAVKRAAPFPQPQRKINVELPIQFSLN